MNGGTALIFSVIVKELFGLRDDALFIGSDEANGTGFDSLGTLGFFAQDEDWFAEGGSFFLDSAGVGDEENGTGSSGE